MSKSLSNPDQIARLKAVVDTYEKEFSEELESQKELMDEMEKSNFNASLVQPVMFQGVMRVMALSTKLVVAYRDYVRVLEPFMPR